MVRSILESGIPAGLAACLLCASPMAVHALSETPLDMVYEAPRSAVARDGAVQPVASPPTRSCSAAVRLEDVRPNKSTVGGIVFMMPRVDGTPLVGRSIHGGDGLPWLQGAVRSLQAQGFDMVEETAAANPSSTPLRLHVRLRSAQAWTVGTNLVSTVVVEAYHRTPEGDAMRTYVGQGMKTNLMNGDSEFMGVLNAAMADAIGFLARDAVTLCEGRTLAASLP